MKKIENEILALAGNKVVIDDTTVKHHPEEDNHDNKECNQTVKIENKSISSDNLNSDIDKSVQIVNNEDDKPVITLKEKIKESKKGY